jgi:methylmalonyl-CoA mutase
VAEDVTIAPEEPGELSLAADFPAATREQWQRLVEGVLAKSGKLKPGEHGLSGAEEALFTEVEDGLRVQPLYTASDEAAPDPGWPGLAPFTRGGRAAGWTAGSGWDVRQRHADPDPGRANEAVLADLDGGVTSLWLTLGGDGLPVAALPDALNGVYLDLAGVVLDAGGEFPAAAGRLLSLHAATGSETDSATGSASSKATGNLGADPLGLLARTGDDSGTARLLTEAAGLAARCAREFPGVRALTVDALPYHDAGATAAAELGLSMATAVAYLRALTDPGSAGTGLTVDEAAGQLEFRYAATADQFLTIAKLRAARRLWSRVARVCGTGPGPAAQRQHAVTSAVMMTRRDPWVNMLRTTVACLGASVGGADAITVLPFDSALGLPDDFARRIARNTQAIAAEEANLARVIDPAGGSWYVESLTGQLATAAWEAFQLIERAGGQRAALRSGLIAERIAAGWARRTKNLARRREAVTGVSEFPDLAERPVVRDPAPSGPVSARPGGLPRVRRSELFESLRDRSDKLVEVRGERPAVVLVGIGPPAVFSARVAFAGSLFQSGGLDTPLCEAPGADPDWQALAEAFAASGASVACVCSSDALYAEHAEAAASALKAAGARRVLLAGRPPSAGSYESIDDFVYTGCDAVAALTAILGGESR